MGNDAYITVKADASAAETAAAAVKNAWVGAGEALKSSIGGAAKSVVSSLAEIALSAGKINFAAQHEQVKAFEASTARLAVAAGRDLEGLRSEFEQTGKAIGKRPSEVAAWTSEVGRLTYNFDGASKSMKGMAELSSATGRSVEDYRGLAVELATVGKVTGDTTHVIGVMAAQADKLGVSGGIAAFADQIEDLGGTISMFASKGEADFTKVTALAAQLGKGLSPQQAGRAQQGAFGAIAADPMRWSRFLGKDVLDKQGHVENPADVMRQITEKVKKQFGGSALKVMRQTFGVEAGSAMFNADYGEAAKAAGLSAKSTPAEKLKEYQATDAGKREAATAQLDVSSRALMGSATKLGSAADAMQKFAANNPITSTLVATALSTGSAAALGGIGKLLAGGGNTTGGLAGALGKTGIGGAIGKLGAVGLAAGSVYHAYNEISGTADELYGKDGKGGSFTGDLKEYATGKTAVSQGNKGFAAYQEENARNVALAHAKMAAAGSGGGAGTQTLTAKELTEAVKDGAKEGIKNARIVNMTSPVEASQQSSESPAAGNQST